MPAAQSGEAWSTQAVLDALFQSSDASILSPDSIQGELLDTQGTSEDLTLAERDSGVVKGERGTDFIRSPPDCG